MDSVESVDKLIELVNSIEGDFIIRIEVEGKDEDERRDKGESIFT